MPNEKPSIIKKGSEARETIHKAVQKVASVVKATLGPGGKNSLIQQGWRGQRITNDGVTIARSIVLDDECENLVAKTFVEAADRTNKDAGDGTTTSITLAEAILNKALDSLGGKRKLLGSKSSGNAMELRRKIEEEKNILIQEIKDKSRKIKSKKELAQVAAISLEDEELGKKVAGVIWEIGSDGYIKTVDGWTSEVETEVVKGMKFDGKYIDSRLATSSRKAIYEHYDILVTNHKFDFQSVTALDQLIYQLQQKGKRGLVIIAENYDRDAQNIILSTTLSKEAPTRILAVKAPSLPPDEFQDVATYAGAKFIDKNQEMEIANVTLDDLGKADEVATDEDETNILGGGGDKKQIKERRQKILDEVKQEKVEEFRHRLEIRAANMAVGTGVIRAGAVTEARRKYLIKKLEDAGYAAQAALAEGVVSGGGLALKELSEKHPDFFLAEPLTAPYKQIQENAGGIEIGKDVYDPVKVTRLALSNACDIAGDMLTTESLVAEKKDRSEYEGLTKLADQQDISTRIYARRHALLEEVDKIKYIKHDKSKNVKDNLSDFKDV